MRVPVPASLALRLQKKVAGHFGLKLSDVIEVQMFFASPCENSVCDHNAVVTVDLVMKESEFKELWAAAVLEDITDPASTS